jgi:hypothetical protein
MTGRAGAWVRTEPLLVGGIFAGLAARIVTWAVSDRRLDDALITIKFAKNTAGGTGLVHHLGEGHIQGFTSALSVLVPLPGELVAAGGGLLLLRLVSLAAFVLTAVYAYRICRELEIGPWPTGFVLAYLALDLNQVFFGMAGMETQIAVAVLLAGAYYVLRTDYTRAGVALGLALLARPDFVLWLIPAYLFLILHDPRRAARAGLISAAILAPWLIFTTIYYGSPVPHTIEAKQAFFAPTFPQLTDPGGILDFASTQLNSHGHDWSLLAPFRERLFIAATPFPEVLLKAVAWAVGLLAIAGAALTWNRPSWRPAIVCAVLYVAYKLFFLGFGYIEWYSAPPLALIFILAAAGLDRLSAPRPAFAAVAATGLALLYVIQLPFVLPLDARTQRIEDRVRERLGSYLGRVLKPGQTYASESAGYVAYDTNATLYDFPGLTSNRVVDTLRGSSGASLQLLVARLHPDWLVMRPYELDSLRQGYPAAASRYQPVRRFREPHPQPLLDHWGVQMLNLDQDFIVLRRVPAQAGREPG